MVADYLGWSSLELTDWAGSLGIWIVERQDMSCLLGLVVRGEKKGGDDTKGRERNGFFSRPHP